MPEETDYLKVLNALQNAGVVKATDTTQASNNNSSKPTPAAKEQLFSANTEQEYPVLEDNSYVAAASAVASSDSPDVAITSLSKITKLDITKNSEQSNSANKYQMKSKQERMLVQKQNDMDALQKSNK